MARKKTVGQPSEPKVPSRNRTEATPSEISAEQALDDKQRLFEEFQNWIETRLARSSNSGGVPAAEVLSQSDKQQRGPARKHPDQGVRRLAIDISVETWHVMKVESARTGKTIKDLLCECVVDRYGGQTVAEAKKKARISVGAPMAAQADAGTSQAEKPARPRVQIEPNKAERRKTGTPSVGADILFSVVEKSTKD